MRWLVAAGGGREDGAVGVTRSQDLEDKKEDASKGCQPSPPSSPLCFSVLPGVHVLVVLMLEAPEDADYCSGSKQNGSVHPAFQPIPPCHRVCL